MIINRLYRSRRRVIEPISFEESERRALLQKEWARFRGLERRNDNETITRMMYAQQKAIDELRFESEELYEAAVQVDPNLVPIKLTGPVVTPAIENYDPPAECFF